MTSSLGGFHEQRRCALPRADPADHRRRSPDRWPGVTGLLPRQGAPVLIDGEHIYNAYCGLCTTLRSATAGLLIEAGWTPSGFACWYCPQHLPRPATEYAEFKKWWEHPADIGPDTARAMFEPFPPIEDGDVSLGRAA